MGSTHRIMVLEKVDSRRDHQTASKPLGARNGRQGTLSGGRK